MSLRINSFNELPDEALTSMKAMTTVLDIGQSTGWSRVKSDPTFPQPIRLSAKCTRFRVGDIRKYVATKAAQ